MASLRRGRAREACCPRPVLVALGPAQGALTLPPRRAAATGPAWLAEALATALTAQFLGWYPGDSEGRGTEHSSRLRGQREAAVPDAASGSWDRGATPVSCSGAAEGTHSVPSLDSSDRLSQAVNAPE